MKIQSLRQNGFSIIELLIAFGVLGVIALTSSFLLGRMMSEQQQMLKKADNISVEALAQRIILNNSSCDCQIPGNVFDSTNPDAVIELNSLKSGCEPNASVFVRAGGATGTTNDIVSRIYIDGISSTGNYDEYNARLRIVPQAYSAKSRIIKPTPLILRFHTDPKSPAAQKVILGCGPAPLSIPSHLVAKVQDGACLLNWKHSSGAAPIRYRVYSSMVPTQANDKDGQQTCLPYASTNSCTASGLTNGTTYYFALQAFNNYESTAFSSPEVSCRPVRIPDAPTGVASETGDKSCQISWTPSLNGTPVIEYEVRYSTAMTNVESGKIGCTSTSNTCEVQGLINDTTYYFAVRGSNFGGAGPYSNPVVTCKPQTLPSAPTQLTAVPNYGQCDLTWKRSATGGTPIYYTLYRSALINPFDSETEVPNCAQLDITGCTDAGLTNGKTYYYAVEAQNDAGTAMSTILSCTPQE